MKRLVSLGPRAASSQLMRCSLVLLLVTGSVLLAQPLRGGRGGGFGRGGGRGRTFDRSEYPIWENPPRFGKDVFTFARVQYDAYYGQGWGGGFGGWTNDYPDCDLNFSFRLQQMTAIRTDPDGKVVRLTDEDLGDCPFLYMSNIGRMALSDDECAALRRHLLKGGFLMTDDFWAQQEWHHVREEMRRVFPDRTPRELTLDHDLFHIVYDLKQIPQVPSIRAFRNGDPVERWHGPFENGDERPHFYAIHDDSGRIMALLCHNNDIGDGWEREGENREYFELYSEKFSYPIGINIVTYAMTH